MKKKKKEKKKKNVKLQHRTKLVSAQLAQLFIDHRSSIQWLKSCLLRIKRSRTLEPVFHSLPPLSLLPSPPPPALSPSLGPAALRSCRRPLPTRQIRPLPVSGGTPTFSLELARARPHPSRLRAARWRSPWRRSRDPASRSKWRPLTRYPSLALPICRVKVPVAGWIGAAALRDLAYC
jgi:hypothetical protein